MEYNELSLKCLPGQILKRRGHEMHIAKYVGSTDRRPKPNATEPESNTSGLSWPSFRYRSGRYSMGSVKVVGSCNMDLIKKVRTESKRNRLYWPSISDHSCPFWNVVTVIFIVASSHMGNTFGSLQDGSNQDGKNNPPRGATKCQRIDSLTMALIYGREGRSSKSGKRFGPTTASSSAWAFFWTSGLSAIARNSACTVETV